MSDTEKLALWDELADALADAVADTCQEADGRLDSCASTGRAENIRLLERLGWVRVVEERSPRWIIAEWVPSPPAAEAGPPGPGGDQP